MSRPAVGPIDRRLVRETLPGLEEKPVCARCRESVRISTGSYFTSDVICLDCRYLEENHPAYDEAKRRELEAVKSGDYNFVGIGLPGNWTTFVVEFFSDLVFEFYAESPLRIAQPASVAVELGIPRRYVHLVCEALVDEKKLRAYSYSNRPTSFGLWS